METCENCKRIEDMYIKDISELNAEIARLKRENSKLMDQLGMPQPGQKAAKHQIRHI